MDVERARTIAAIKPRRLRLDELLRELGARDEPAASDSNPALGVDAATAEVARKVAKINVGDLVDKAAEAGFGFLVGVMGLIAIPFFALSTPFGLAIALIGAQLAIGKLTPWLPQRARRRQLSLAMLDRVLRMLGRLRWLAAWSRRRYERAIMPRAIGLGIMLLALGLALPLPIPGSNLIFIVPIIIYAIGLLERDGVWIMLGHLGTLVNMTLLVVFGATVVNVLERVVRWLF